jgi:hypothetical protein
MSKIVKLKEATEEHEQTIFVVWLKKQGFWVSASANGGSRNLFEAMKLKRMGVSAGFPDIFVPLPTPKYHGFFCEMKRLKGGKVSEAQLEWLQYLRDKGYYAEVAQGADEAKELFKFYLSTMPSVIA